jgi:hypothetical protein
VNGTIPPDKPSRKAYDEERRLRRPCRNRDGRGSRKLPLWGRSARRQNRTFGREIACVRWRRCSNAGIARKTLASTRRPSRDGKKSGSNNNRACHERTSILKAHTGLERTHGGVRPRRKDPPLARLLRFGSAHSWQIRSVRYTR